MSPRLTSIGPPLSMTVACIALLAVPASAAGATHPTGGSGFDDGVEGWSASGQAPACPTDRSRRQAKATIYKQRKLIRRP